MRSTGRILAAGIIGLLAIGSVAACGGEMPSASPTGASSSPGASEPVASPTPAGSIAATVVEPGLLDILPVEVDGRDRRDDAETAAEIAADGSLQESVEAVALALFADTESYVVTTVSRLRPGVYDDAFFRDWRDTFDAAVCEQAGGVDVGHGEVEIDDRQVFRSACVGGVVIYHVHLDDPDTLLSLQGAGPVDLGALVLADLRTD